MFAKAYRVGRADFDDLLKSRIRYHGEFCTLIYTPTLPFAVSVVVSKKVSKLAVKRNLIRRRVYGRVRTVLKTLPNNGVYIFLIKPNTKIATKSNFLSDIDSVLAQIAKSR